MCVLHKYDVDDTPRALSLAPTPPPVRVSCSHNRDNT